MAKREIPVHAGNQTPVSQFLSYLFVTTEGRLKSSWTGDSAQLLCRGRHSSITLAHCRQSRNFWNGPHIYAEQYY